MASMRGIARTLLDSSSGGVGATTGSGVLIFGGRGSVYGQDDGVGGAGSVATTR